MPLMASTPFHRPRCMRVLVALCGAIFVVQLLLLTRPTGICHASSTVLHHSGRNDDKPAKQSPIKSPGWFHRPSTPVKDGPKGPGAGTPPEKANVESLEWKINSSFLIPHGSSNCMPSLPNTTNSRAQETRHLCEQYSPFNITSTSTTSPRIALLTAHYGSNSAYDPALLTHLTHGLVHEHQVRVLCDPIVDAIWNKPAFLLNIMMEEMMKPKDERLEWIFWADRDTMVLDQCRPISSFLPPERSVWDPPRPTPKRGFFSRIASMFGFGSAQPSEPQDIHLLATNDKNGLNAGIFILRISSVSISFLTAILSYPTHHPKTRLRFDEQTAMSLLIKSPKFRPHTQIVPQHWFNSYTYTDRDEKGNNRGYKGDQGDHDSGSTVYAERMNTTGLEGGFREGYVRRGDFLVHFAGNKKKDQNVRRWATMLAKEGVVWESKGGVQRDGSKEVRKFWEDMGY
ncbi:unnamed protein product [Periconia digitata]|uniref:Glycosyltransferase family 34 protein n=1 Tax=Periconia digitata TaxID=1303443 RepID=A0A9W4XT60_9PLEO|nr:unnamed protein product [Periconia digitata]